MSAHRRAATLAGCALLALLLSASPARAQLAVYPVQDLSFGTLVGGMATQVQPSDAQRRGEIEILGRGNYTVSLALPTHMVSAAGHTLPLSFGPADAIFRWRKNGREVPFDPMQPSAFHVPFKDGGAIVYLGGLAVPAPDQPPGTYTATLVVQVVDTGT